MVGGLESQWHRCSVLSVPLRSHDVGMIRDITDTWYEAMHVGSSFTHSRGLCCITVCLFVVMGSGFGWSIHDVLSVPDFVPGQTKELIHIFVQQK